MAVKLPFFSLTCAFADPSTCHRYYQSDQIFSRASTHLANLYMTLQAKLKPSGLHICVFITHLVLMATISMDPYQYKRLSSPTNVRRLQYVNIEPEKGLHFLIAEFDQDNSSAPPYYCLSYTWGNPLDCDADPNADDEWSEKHRIYIYGYGEEWREFFVTTNLYEFLCEYSREALSSEVSSKVSWIWIDAICIDQLNVSEREVQVSLMQKVYLSCAEVIIWLGREMTDVARIRVRTPTSSPGLEEFVIQTSRILIINFVSGFSRQS